MDGWLVKLLSGGYKVGGEGVNTLPSPRAGKETTVRGVIQLSKCLSSPRQGIRPKEEDTRETERGKKIILGKFLEFDNTSWCMKWIIY